MNVELKPYAITYSEQFEYSVRAEALRILGSGCDIGVAPNDTLNHPRLHEVLLCLCYMAFGGFVDHYDGDTEAASWAVMRESMMCSELESLETDLIYHEGTGTLKAIRPDPQQVEMAAMRAECAAITANTSEVRAQVQRPQLPPGARVSLRGLAIMRQREREDNGE
jgi:hypothetical protein